MVCCAGVYTTLLLCKLGLGLLLQFTCLDYVNRYNRKAAARAGVQAAAPAAARDSANISLKSPDVRPGLTPPQTPGHRTQIESLRDTPARPTAAAAEPKKLR